MHDGMRIHQEVHALSNQGLGEVLANHAALVPDTGFGVERGWHIGVVARFNQGATTALDDDNVEAGVSVGGMTVGVSVRTWLKS